MSEVATERRSDMGYVGGRISPKQAKRWLAVTPKHVGHVQSPADGVQTLQMTPRRLIKDITGLNKEFSTKKGK